MKIAIPQSLNHARNRDRCDGDKTPCYICGKGKKPKRAETMIWVVDGGAVAATQEERVAPGGDMGLHPIGADCLRHNPQLKPFVIVRDTGAS